VSSTVDAIALSGIAAATLKLNASASNLANANDTSALGAKGYLPLKIDNSAAPGGGVIAQAVTLKPGTTTIYDPSSASANALGFAQAPEIDPISETSNLFAAGQAFAFSVKVLNAANENEQTLLDMKT
jgi:flagellar basal-body rod protein FlgC